MVHCMTAQLDAWTGEFGDAYTVRQADNLSDRRAMWSRIFDAVQEPLKSILEVGANTGDNLRALPPDITAELIALEPNLSVWTALGRAAHTIIPGSAESIPLPDGSVDMTFTCGVLIHIHPDNLLKACSEIHRVTRRYILCIEYFSAEPEEKHYRGHDGLLFKRDFGSFWLDNFPDLVPVDHGFFWKRTAKLDNLTLFFFLKT